ncbi:MAG: SIMPL domain-containing protein [Thermoproteota archaeon]
MSDQKTNRRIFALIAGILAISMVAASIAGGQMLSAQAQNSDDPMPVDLECPTGAEVCEQEIEDAVQSIVSTSGTATVNVTPDKVSVTIGVETRGETAEEAAAANAELMEKVLAALRDLGIAEDQISTSWYTVWPVYEWRSPPCIDIYPQPPECAPKSEITGYAASNSVTVTLDAEADVGEVIDEAVAAGATNVNGAYFFVSSERQEEIREGLIADAIANARSRADKAAEAVDMEITGVKSINLNDVYFPVLYRDLSAAGGASPTPILSGQQEISMTVQVTFRMS